MQMAKELGQQHAVDLRNMGRPGGRFGPRAIRWRWRDSRQLRSSGWGRRGGWRLRPGGWRHRIVVRWQKRLAAAAEGGSCQT
jgi:hypothetical protein